MDPSVDRSFLLLDYSIGVLLATSVLVLLDMSICITHMDSFFPSNLEFAKQSLRLSKLAVREWCRNNILRRTLIIIYYVSMHVATRAYFLICFQFGIYSNP
jgi:hypothetical protein